VNIDVYSLLSEFLEYNKDKKIAFPPTVVERESWLSVVIEIKKELYLDFQIHTGGGSIFLDFSDSPDNFINSRHYLAVYFHGKEQPTIWMSDGCPLSEWKIESENQGLAFAEPHVWWPWLFSPRVTDQYVLKE